MSQSIINSQLICELTRVWYLGVEGRCGIKDYLAHLMELEKRLMRDRIWGVIIDYRRLSGFPPAQEWSQFVQQARVKFSNGLRIAVLTSPQLPLEPLKELIRATEQSKADVQIHNRWDSARHMVGLPDKVTDPRPDDPEDEDDEDDSFLLD